MVSEPEKVRGRDQQQVVASYDWSARDSRRRRAWLASGESCRGVPPWAPHRGGGRVTPPQIRDDGAPTEGRPYNVFERL